MVAGSWKCRKFPGVLCYGKTADEAMVKAEALALGAMTGTA